MPSSAAASCRPKCASSNSCRSAVWRPTTGTGDLSRRNQGWHQLGHQQVILLAHLPAWQTRGAKAAKLSLPAHRQGDVQAVAIQHGHQLHHQGEVRLVALVLVDAAAELVAKVGLGSWVIACQP